jgi:hypothetical protein
MSIELTAEQHQAVKNGEPVRVHANDIGADVVVVRADHFEHLQELLKDDLEQSAFRAAGLRSATRWMKENPY